MFKKLFSVLAAVIVLAATASTSMAVPAASGSDAPAKVKVSGKVVDEAGVPVIGIAVISSDGMAGTITNDAGLFYSTVPEGDILTVTGIGYQDAKVSLDGRTELLIVLKTDTQLEEAVLVGFGTQKKESVIGAIASIAPETLQSNQTANLSNALAGQIATQWPQSKQGAATSALFSFRLSTPKKQSFTHMPQPIHFS